MPYVTDFYRERVDESLDKLIKFISDVGSDASPGVLNYCITRLVHGLAGPYDLKDGESPIWNYRRVNAAIGVLECAKQELYRRIAIPYEDKKIKESGDVEEYDRWNKFELGGA